MIKFLFSLFKERQVECNICPLHRGENQRGSSKKRTDDYKDRRHASLQEPRY